MSGSSSCTLMAQPTTKNPRKKSGWLDGDHDQGLNRKIGTECFWKIF